MKLIDIVKDIDPGKDFACVVQDGDGVVKFMSSMPLTGSDEATVLPDSSGDWWGACPIRNYSVCNEDCCVDGKYHEVPLSEDWNTAIITKDQWEAAQRITTER